MRALDRHETYDRHAEKLREEITLAWIGRHSGQLEDSTYSRNRFLENATPDPLFK